MNYIVIFIVIFCNNLEACKVASLLYEVLYHTIENTANQNTGKPLYIPRYSTQPSHRALRSYSRRNLVSVFSMAWYKIVIQHFLVVYYGISHLSLSLAHHESLVAQEVRACNRYSGRPWVRFSSGTQNFSLSHARVIVEKDHLHYLLPSLKFTIFIIYYTFDDFDIADPSSTVIARV